MPKSATNAEAMAVGSPSSRPSVQTYDIADQLAALAERTRLLEAVVDNFPGGISVYDSNLRMVLCNEQQKDLLDYPDDLFQNGYPTLEETYRFNAARGEYGPGDVDEQVKLRLDLAKLQKAHTFERTRPNGTILEVRGVPLASGGFVTTYIDVTEQRQAQATINHMAHHDALTDLPNRVLFRDRLDQAVARVKRGESISLHYVDLDRFKPVNDSHGHEVGDVLLQSVAERLVDVKRDMDTAARLGGDEFVLIQTAINEDADAELFADRLIGALSRPYAINGQNIEIGASVGIAVAPRHGTDPEELLRNADAALYQSKLSGRGTFSFYV